MVRAVRVRTQRRAAPCDDISLEVFTMPPHSRAQRRRQAARSAPRPPRGAGAPASVEAEPLERVEEPVVPAAPPTPATLSAPRAARPGRRAAARVLEPVDYSQDYASARRDLTRIAVISALLFAAMVALSFSGLL
jgi:hypothetical protein